MKFPFSNKKNQGAALLLVCMGAAVIIGFPLTYYLAAVLGENATVARAQAWNNSMVIAEAGVEEGMSFVNKYANSGTPLTSWSILTGPDSAVWTQIGTNVFTLSRNLGAGSYTLIVTNVSATNVMIKATGTVPGPNIWEQQSGATISRATLINAVVFGQATSGGGLKSKGDVTLSGGALIDSFDSSNPLYSTNGQYSASMHEAHGDILITSGNLTIGGSSHIYGIVYQNPVGTILMTGGATIGDVDFAGPGIQAGYTNNTANIIIPDAPPVPNASWNSLPTKINNTYVLDGGGTGETNYYTVPDGFNLSGGQVFLATNGTVILNAVGTFAISGSSSIQLAANANLIAWFNGSTALSGGGIVNMPGYAKNLTIYGTPTCTKIAYSGNSSFIGVIDAPQADCAWTGSADVIGAFVVNSFNDSGGAAIHFDEGLLGSQANSYVVTTWHEVPP